MTESILTMGEKNFVVVATSSQQLFRLLVFFVIVVTIAFRYAAVFYC